jgi:putative protease
MARTIEQVRALLDLGSVPEIYLDFMELVGLGGAVAACKERGVRTVVATPRIQKPGEEPIDRRFETLAPDGILARHLGALHHYRARAAGTGFSLHGDFSLNAANADTARTLLEYGLATLTPSYDLNVDQLREMVAGLPRDRLELTLHQHLPLYHTEYCLYAHHLSEGRDFRSCGRPCDHHRVALRDPRGLEHPVLVDVNCRNTVFEARAQSAAAHLAGFLASGLRRFRVELVWETGPEAARVFQTYRDLLDGRVTASEVARRLDAVERYGVTAGTLAVVV